MTNRFSRLFLALTFCALASALADENVRVLQAKLREGGFYAGKVDGAYNADVSAALTRFQIRNGLQITGKLDQSTSAALGVAATTASPPDSTNGAWRSLRNGGQVLKSLKRAPKTAKVAREVSPSQPSSASTAALVPAQDGDDSTLALSPERLRDYVGAFVLAGIDPQVGAELEFFGERVRYYGDGLVDREKIRRDLIRYDARWPERHFWLAGDVQVAVQADSRLRVNFPLRFELRNGSKHSSGLVQKQLLLEVIEKDLQIVAVNETKTR